MAAVAHSADTDRLRLHGIDHVVVPVTSYEAAKRLYRHALAPLGFALRLDWPDRSRAYLGVGDELSSVWLVERRGAGPIELALAAPDRDSVNAFYAAALAAGAHPSREPGPYAELNARAYGAQVRDPDGNLVDVVCRL